MPYEIYMLAFDQPKPKALLHNTFVVRSTPKRELCTQWAFSTSLAGKSSGWCQHAVHRRLRGMVCNCFTQSPQVLQYNVCYPCRIAFNLDQCRHQVNWRLTKIRFYFQCLGVKGDWPWLRSAYRLVTGYKSKRLCHRCPSLESSHMDLVKHFILSFTNFIVCDLSFDWYIVQSKCSTLLLRTGTTWAPAGPSGRGRRMASQIAHSKLD